MELSLLLSIFWGYTALDIPQELPKKLGTSNYLYDYLTHDLNATSIRRRGRYREWLDESLINANLNFGFDELNFNLTFHPNLDTAQRMEKNVEFLFQICLLKIFLFIYI